MARVTGPLMSYDASGTVASSITFARWKGRAYVRRWAKPSNPQSALQIYNRSLMKFLSQAWASIGAVAKATWDTLADAGKFSAFNACIKSNMSAWQSTLHPLDAAGATRSTTALQATLAVTGGVGMATVVITPSATADPWGYIIYRKLAGAPTGTPDEVCAVVPDVGGAGATYIDAGLAAGVWHYKVTQFAIVSGGNSDVDLISADASDTVT